MKDEGKIREDLISELAEMRRRVGELETAEAERRLAEKLLQEYQEVVEISPDLIAVVDQQYIYLLVNNTLLRCNRLRRDQVIGHSIAQVLGEEVFKTTIKPHLDRCLLGEQVHMR